MSARGHRWLDHTADLALEVWAATEAELLEEAARAAVGVLAEGVEPGREASRPVRIDALDPEDRLVQWLNEVIYLAVVQGFLVAGTDLRLTDGVLEGTVWGQEGGRNALTSELKSATYHDLGLWQAGDGWRAHVVLDV